MPTFGELPQDHQTFWSAPVHILVLEALTLLHKANLGHPHTASYLWPTRDHRVAG